LRTNKGKCGLYNRLVFHFNCSLIICYIPGSRFIPQSPGLAKEQILAVL
jgi:hypothetical protein